MQATRLALVAALSVAAFAAFAAHADDADASQYVHQFTSQQTRAAVTAQVAPARQAANPWSTSYNPLASFRSERTRVDVQADYRASRNAVAAMTGEDSGSAYLATRQPGADATQLAGQPVNAR